MRHTETKTERAVANVSVTSKQPKVGGYLNLKAKKELESKREEVVK